MEELLKKAVEFEGVKYLPLEDVEVFIEKYYDNKLQEVSDLISGAMQEFQNSVKNINTQEHD